MKSPKILALITIVFWSFGSYLSRLMAIKSQYLLLSLSYIFTFVTMLVYCFYESRSSFLTKVKRTGVRGIFIGPFGYFIYSVGLMQSYRAFDSASETTILNYTWPIFTVIITNLFFREKSLKSHWIKAIEILGIMLGFLAVVILATQGKITTFEISNSKGIVWGLISGISYGLFSSYSSSITKDELSAFLFSSITFSLILMIIFSVQELNLIKELTIKDILIVAMLGCLLNGLGYVSWTTANRLAREKNISISSVASLMFLLPLLSLIIITVLLKEATLIQPYFLTSLVLIIISGILSQKPGIIADLFQKVTKNRKQTRV